jgi:hypothetical protein
MPVYGNGGGIHLCRAVVTVPDTGSGSYDKLIFSQTFEQYFDQCETLALKGMVKHFADPHYFHFNGCVSCEMIRTSSGPEVSRCTSLCGNEMVMPAFLNSRSMAWFRLCSIGNQLLIPST